MKYLLLIYQEEQKLSEESREHCYIESTQLAHDLNEKGQYLAANPLHPVAAATSVRVREGTTMITDGPFAETREQLGGYFLIEAQDLDEAIAIAARIPGARAGTVEIRPVLELLRFAGTALSAALSAQPRSLSCLPEMPEMRFLAPWARP